METFLFEKAIKAIADNNYTSEHIKDIKNYLHDLNKEDIKLKLQIDDLTSKFIKDKNKLKSDIKINQQKIKQVKGILKNL